MTLNATPPDIPDPDVFVSLPAQWEVVWLDPALYDTPVEGLRIAAFERRRRFTHMGAAITWCRKRLFHGEVFGDSVQMRTLTRHTDGGVLTEYETNCVEITLPGFRKFEDARLYLGNRKATIDKPKTKGRTR